MDNLDELERQRSASRDDKDLGGNKEAKTKEISKMSLED
jgi:hypothetical protein